MTMKRLLSRYIMDIANTAQNTSPRKANSKDRDTEIIHKLLFQDFKDIQIAVGVGLIFDTPGRFLDYAC